jgi:hypothetical protein
MDDRSFDAFVKALAAGRNRRALLKGLLGLGGAALTAGVVLDDDADAARRPTPTPVPPRCPGNQIPGNGGCVCPAGLSKCGPACCNPGGVGASHSECCDNACCNGYCYGEELCCPYPREFCPITGECCGDGVDCCANEGCCPDGACVTSQGAETCCPLDQYCPADVRSGDVCCPPGWLCCNAGAAGRLCVDPAAGACCQDSDCPAVGTACGACVANTCAAAPCGACEACAGGRCVGCEEAGYGCCNNDGACVECCNSEMCGPYRDCDLYICMTCEEGQAGVPCAEPPCPSWSHNCCCPACSTDGDCSGCETCYQGACVPCSYVGLKCAGDHCGECTSSEECGPYRDCDNYMCLTCEEGNAGAPCGEPPCPSWSNNCCCPACTQDADCASCEGCSQGACIPCSALELQCAGDHGCGECTASEQCGPYYDCDNYMCLTCDEAGGVRCGEPPCAGGPGVDHNCCCFP